MYKLLATVKKRPEVSAEDFWSFWSGPYAERVLALPQVKQFRVNGALARPGHRPAFDGVAEIWVESAEDAQAVREALNTSLAELQAPYIDRDQTRTVLTEERVIISPPAEGTTEVKLCEVVYRRPDLDFDQFNRHWHEQHPIPVRKLKGLRGYLQHPAVQEGENPPYDGHVMVWFETLDDARQSLRTPEGEAVLADEKHFIDSQRIERVAVRERRLK